MKIVVKSLKGTRFEIEVEPKDLVSKVKKNIETVLGASAYPAAQQILIHKGKVLKDETTMEANKISEKSSIAIMMTKTQEPPPSNSGPLDFLRDTEQYRWMHPLVKAKPALLRGFLEDLRRLNPPLLQIILGNKAEFIRMLNEEPLERNQWEHPEARQDREAEILRLLNQEPTQGGDGGKELAQPEDALQLRVTAVESEAIKRLEAMGFERWMVLEAFFACNKNEQLAANYLLDHIHESQ